MHYKGLTSVFTMLNITQQIIIIVFCCCVFIVQNVSARDFDSSTTEDSWSISGDADANITSGESTITDKPDDNDCTTDNFNTINIESRFGRPEKSSKKECVLDLTNSKYEKYLPVPVYKDALDTYHEVVPQNGKVRLAVGQKIVFVCPGSRNKLKLAPKAAIHFPTCVRDNTLKLGNKNQNISKFECSHIVKGEVRKTKISCGNGQGTYFEIGHKISKENFVKLIGICYNIQKNTPIYAEHILHGTEVMYASKSSYRPSFSTEGLTVSSKFNPQIAYKKDTQKELFQNNFGLKKIITDAVYLARGHLAPDSDFILASSQYSTFFYLNVAPMWQPVNNKNWKILENTIRSYSSSLDKLKIITGTHEQLCFNDVNNNQVPVFLSNEVLPVPKYFWKVVYDFSTQRAIVFVVFNNPFLKNKPKDLFCLDICASAGWLHPQWKKLDSGYIFCCDFRKFRKVVPTAPKLSVRGVLGGNKY